MGLRIRLRLTGAPELDDLPWEFLYTKGRNRFLALSKDTPLVRYLDLPERIRPFTITPPIRILLIVSSPTDYATLDVDRECDNVQDALADLERRGLVSVERVDTATLAELQRRLRQGPYHIFHFIGHGGFSREAEDGFLLLEDDKDRGRQVSAQFLGTLLHDHRPLRLAMLNACEGARASRQDPFAGTAQSLVQQGIPAVIAMQFEITDEAAICLTNEFYAALADGYPVDAALAEARRAIFAHVSETEWATPVLYMRAPDGRIFDVQAGSAKGHQPERPQPTEAQAAAAQPIQSAKAPTPAVAPVEAPARPVERPARPVEPRAQLTVTTGAYTWKRRPRRLLWIVGGLAAGGFLTLVAIVGGLAFIASVFSPTPDFSSPTREVVRPAPVGSRPPPATEVAPTSRTEPAPKRGYLGVRRSPGPDFEGQRRGHVFIEYPGDQYACTVNIRVFVGDRSYQPTGQRFVAEDIPIGNVLYIIEGAIACPTIGTCNATGRDVVDLASGDTLHLLWRNTTYGQCQVSLVKQ
jgi:CHAT domain